MEGNYQLSRIHNYINGLMSKEDMHSLEQEALQDPFLQDAIDGYRLQNGVDARSLSLLQQRLERRVAEHTQLKNKHFFGWQRLAIGLAAAVLFISVCMLLFIRYFPTNKVASVTEVELMDDELSKVHTQALSGNNAQPIAGWESFNSYLSQNYSAKNSDKEISISFKIDASGSPYAIQPQLDKSHDMYDELVKLIESGPKWKGDTAVLKITFPE